MIHLLLPSGTPEEKEIFAYQQLLLGSAWIRDMPTLESAVAALRHRNGEIDKKDEHGQTALSISARCGHSTGVKYLLALGRAVVHPATQDNAGRTPLSWALREYSQNVRNYLEDPEGTRRYLWDATGSLVEKGKVKEYDAVVKALAYNDRHVKNLSIADSEGKKILHLAALTGSAKLTKEVCEALGSPPQNDQFDADHRTPLSFAAMHGHAEVVRYLLPDTRQRNALDRGGRTALHLAASCGTGAAAVEALLEAVNINPNVRDPEGKTPLMLAARSPVQESAKVATVKALLKRKDVRVSFVDNLGRTALSYAAETGSPKTVELLMERCSVKDLNTEDYAPWTPLCWAIQSYSLGDLEVISLMLRDKRVVVPDPNLESCHGTKLAIDEVADEDIDGSDELHPTHRPHIRWTSVFLLWMGVWRTWEDDDGHRHWDRVEDPQIPPPEIVDKYIEDSRRLFDSSDIEDRGSGEL
jgi:ankyrin repeat protein